MKDDALDKIEKIMEPYKRIQKLMEPYRKLQQLSEPFRIAQQISDPFIELRKSIEGISKLAFPFNEYFSSIRDLGKRVKEDFEKTPHSLLLLAQYGWYLDFDSVFSLPNELAELVEDKDIESVDSYLIKYYTDSLEDIFKNLSIQHPEREEIFKQILIAHKQNLFFISIPSILAQVDGISNDYTTKKFFLKDKKNNYLPEIAVELSSVSNSVVEMFLTPILNQIPINAHETKLNNYPVQLNRHTILHGIDKKYGTEINSLKCLSLLKYLSDILDNIENKKITGPNKVYTP